MQKQASEETSRNSVNERIMGCCAKYADAETARIQLRSGQQLLPSPAGSVSLLGLYA